MGPGGQKSRWARQAFRNRGSGLNDGGPGSWEKPHCGPTVTQDRKRVERRKKKKAVSLVGVVEYALFL